MNVVCYERVCFERTPYRIAPLTLGTLHCLSVCMVVQLHALSAQQNKHLLSVTARNTSQKMRCCLQNPTIPSLTL